MSDEDDVSMELTTSIQPSAEVALDEQWIAWLRGESVASVVANADDSYDESSSGSQTA